MKARGFVLVPVAVVLLAACVNRAAEPIANDVQDFVFLGEARPVLVRLHVRLDDKPLQTAWDEFSKHLFGSLDHNADGTLDKDEVERAPTIDQILIGGLGGGAGGAAATMGRSAPAPSMDTWDADKNGQVTLAEMSGYYRQHGLAPFQMQLDGSQPNPFAAMAMMGGSRSEPAVAAVSKAAFTLLDADKDDKLTKSELAAAPAVLLRRDEDEDDLVTAAELSPTTAPPASAFAGMMAMAGAGASRSGSGNKTLIPLAAPGEVPATLVRALQERYGPKADKPESKKLNCKDLGLDEPTFQQLDTDTNGELDAAELAGFVKRAADLELVIRLGKKESAQARVEIVPPKHGPAALDGKIQVRDGGALLDLGITRLDLRTTGEERSDTFSSLLRQQFLAQFRQADKDNNDHLDEKEARASGAFRNVFKALDRDGDGRATEQELNAYLDGLRDLQARATASCMSLVLADQSRGLFDLLDVNRDSRLGVRELRGAAGLLEKLDRDGKGYLTTADVPRSYQLTLRRGAPATGQLGGAAAFFELYRNAYSSSSEQATQGTVWFRKMDRNRDGDVSRKEFLFGEEAFRRIDTDGDGLISAEEAAAQDR